MNHTIYKSIFTLKHAETIPILTPILTEGIEPSYMKNLINTNFFNSVQGSRQIRDQYVEYKKVDGKFYLTISTEKIENFEKQFSSLNINNNINKDNINNNNININKKKNININKNKKKININKNFILQLLALIKILLLSIFKKKQSTFKFLTENNFTAKTADKILNSLENKENNKILKKTLKEILLSSININNNNINKEEEKVFKVKIFYGPNGVGKSTLISKLCYKLFSEDRNSKITIIAADTFRSGAIEQLRKYCNNFVDNYSIRLIEGNYGQDENSLLSSVLESVLNEKQTKTASKKLSALSTVNSYNINKNKNICEFVDTDYVLIDTSGRLPSNENLMRALKKIFIKLEKNILSKNIKTIIEKIMVVDLLNINTGSYIKSFSEIAVNSENRSSNYVCFTKKDCVENKLGSFWEAAENGMKIMGYSEGQRNVDYVEMDKETVEEIVEEMFDGN